MPDPRHALGLRGEEAVAGWLTGRGWTPLARRWRCPSGELDLVLLDPDGALVGVEVKVRRSHRSGLPVESVDARRIARLRATLATFARTAPAGGGFTYLRVDLVTLTPVADGRWRLDRLPGIDAW
jgi:putative endonuclease